MQRQYTCRGPITRRELYAANLKDMFIHLQCLPMCADQTDGIIGEHQSYDDIY